MHNSMFIFITLIKLKKVNIHRKNYNKKKHHTILKDK